jgi:hypothetical protein
MFSSNVPGSAMMTWLEADLQAATADWIVAFWHHPPYSKGLLHDSDEEQREIDMRENVLPLLEDYGVDLVLCGHSHSYERSHLLDGHYGYSTELEPEMVLDSGDGDPAGDGAYRKASTGQSPHEGAVYVVAGSSSEVRNTTLNHPVMEIGLLEHGSLVLDVDGDTLTGTFLNKLVQTTDTFTIDKGRPACPVAPRTGCMGGVRAKLVLRDDSGDPQQDRLVWRWKGGPLDPAELGTPQDQTDLAFCIYDQGGKLVGGAVPPGGNVPAGAQWRALGGGLVYLNRDATAAGVERVVIEPDAGVRGLLMVKGRGAELGVPTPPVTPPLVAQLANLDGDTCWESVFTTTRKNEDSKVVATSP